VVAVIRAVAIKGLRGIREGSLADLTPLVVLVGPNGAGKSTILDALLIAANPIPAEGIGLAVERREGLASGARWLFWKGGSDGPAEIRVRTDQVSRVCTLAVNVDARDRTSLQAAVSDGDAGGEEIGGGKILVRFPAEHPLGIGPPNYSRPLDDVPEVRFLDPRAGGLRTPLHQLYTRVVEQGRYKDAIASLKLLIPGVQDIQILAPEKEPIVYLIFDGYAVPAALAGDGIRLLLHLTFELATRPGGLVLMEEPEVHMHPGAIRQCARAILAAMRRKVQIVLCTHSLELIDGLLAESSAADLEQLGLYRVQLQQGNLKSSRLAGPDVAFARSQIEDDLR